jgi:hypothetical protein
LDGVLNGTLGSSVSRTFSFASSGLTHFLSVDYYVPNGTGTNGVRYYEAAPSWSFSGNGSHVFAYSTQYFLTVQTAYSSADGSGWYNSGSAAQVTLKNGEVDEGQGTRLMFTGWSGDATGSNLTSNSIIINAPKTAIAAWKTQFFLTIVSDPSGVNDSQGAGWYDSGTQAAFSATSVAQETEGSRLRFNSWTGDYTGSTATGNVLMDRPKIIIAHYAAQYLVTIEYDPQNILSSYNETHAGWYDAGSVVQLGPAPTIIMISSVERLSFSNWTDNELVLQNVSLSLHLKESHKVILSYVTQYYIDVQTTHGTVSGSGWYNRGSTAKIAAVSDNRWPISYVFSGWNLNPSSGTLTRTDDSWTLLVDHPYTIEATWSVDYLPLIVLFGGGSAGMVAIMVGVLLVHKRRRHGNTVGRGQACRTCGNTIPEGALFCQKCGAPSLVESNTEQVTALEDRVYQYILKHEGVISMSTAARDLGLTTNQLKEVTEKLKSEGRLS